MYVFSLLGSRWRVKDLTYRISKYPSTRRLSKREVDSEVKRALEVWSEFTDLTFTEKSSGRVHIDIRFEKREHGDGDPFDGQVRRNISKSTIPYAPHIVFVSRAAPWRTPSSPCSAATRTSTTTRGGRRERSQVRIHRIKALDHTLRRYIAI